MDSYSIFKMNYKICLLLLSLYIFWTQSQYFLIDDLAVDNSSNSSNSSCVIDRIHRSELVQDVTTYLLANPDKAAVHIATTTFLIDATIVVLMGLAIFDGEYRTPILLFAGIFLRQPCQYITKLPVPDQMIWFDPGFPTLFMVYDVQNDFFFSGHTLIAMIMGGDLLERNIWCKIYGVFFIFYEIAFVLLTRSHYFMDVYAAVATYFMLRYFYGWLESEYDL